MIPPILIFSTLGATVTSVVWQRELHPLQLLDCPEFQQLICELSLCKARTSYYIFCQVFPHTTCHQNHTNIHQKVRMRVKKGHWLLSGMKNWYQFTVSCQGAWQVSWRNWWNNWHRLHGVQLQHETLSVLAAPMAPYVAACETWAAFLPAPFHPGCPSFLCSLNFLLTKSAGTNA